MASTALKVVGIGLLLFIVYVAWVLFSASSTVGLSPKADAEILSSRIRVTVSFPGADTDFQITEIFMPRETGEALGIAAPHGFRIAPYTIDDTGDLTSEDSAAWVTEANSKDIRWVGTLALKPDADTTLDFPIQRTISREFFMLFQYERKVGMGGQMSSLRIPIEMTEH